MDETTPIELRRHIFASGGDRVNSAPQIAMMNALWLREHNRVAGILERANSGWDDERVFQTARMVTIVEYIKVVVEDYINHINPSPLEFRADPTVAWDAPWNKPNWITTEFSLLYRWHSLIPDAITWNGKPTPVGDTFFDNGLLFKSSMADAFASLSDQKTSKLGVFNTADAMIGLEVRSIRQGRICRLQPYAAYKKANSQTAPTKFEDINPDPAVAAKLEALYGSPDRVEFYVGLFSEPVGPDSPLPSLLGTMVAIDAFSQALTNPLLSQYVFNEDTFSPAGWKLVNETSKLEQIVERNCPGLNGRRITFTQPTWKASLSILQDLQV